MEGKQGRVGKAMKEGRMLRKVTDKRFLDVMRQNIEESEKADSQTPDLCSQCSATELWQQDNYQPSQSSMCTAEVVLKLLSHTPGSQLEAKI